VVEAAKQATVLDVDCFRVCGRFVSRSKFSPRKKHGVMTALRLVPGVKYLEMAWKG